MNHSIEQYRQSFIPALTILTHELSRMFPGKQTGRIGNKVTARLKTSDSIFEKMQRRNIYPEQMTDIGGIRILFPDIKSVYDGASKIRQRFIILEEEDYIDRPKSGYRGYHMLVKAGDKVIEVQLKTPMMEEWTYISHATMYKRAAPKRAQAYVRKMGDYYSRMEEGQKAKRPKTPSMWKRMKYPAFALNPIKSGSLLPLGLLALGIWLLAKKK
jgi:ppGpp synthetase/RelA/SpoT-type nucleotidyltranferase